MKEVWSEKSEVSVNGLKKQMFTHEKFISFGLLQAVSATREADLVVLSSGVGDMSIWIV